MSLAAIKIVSEEFKRRRDVIPDIHSAHAQLSTLEARIIKRIEEELVEIPEATFDDKLDSLRSSARWPTLQLNKEHDNG
jgi:hypothetical protein